MRLFSKLSGVFKSADSAFDDFDKLFDEFMATQNEINENFRKQSERDTEYFAELRKAVERANEALRNRKARPPLPEWATIIDCGAW